jgi:hypothetical protein
MTKAEQAIHLDGYLLGVLHAVEFAQSGHGEGVIATELVTHVLAGTPLKRLKALAKRESVTIDWRDIEHDIQRRSRVA